MKNEMIISAKDLLKTRLSIMECVHTMQCIICLLWIFPDHEIQFSVCDDDNTTSLLCNHDMFFLCTPPLGYRISLKKQTIMNDCPANARHRLEKHLSLLLKILYRRKSHYPEAISRCISIFQEQLSQCDLCLRRQHDLQKFRAEDHMKIRPWLYSHHPCPNAMQFMERHCEFIDHLLFQVRHEENKKWISETVYQQFMSLVPDITSLLTSSSSPENRDVRPFVLFGTLFQKAVMNSVHTRFKFISDKNIAFDVWFESLFRFHVLCSFSDNRSWKKHMDSCFFQLLLVLYDYEAFLEERGDPPSVINRIIFQDEIFYPVERTECHPLYRGYELYHRFISKR